MQRIRNTKRHWQALYRTCLTTLAIASITSTHAAMVVTRAESPSSYTSTLSGTSTLTFDLFPLDGITTNYVWTDGTQTIGTIDQVHTYPVDEWGGAGNPVSDIDRYPAQSQLNGAPTTTITFDHPMAYFGLWWSAGDPSNRITFRLGDQVVAEFTSSDILDLLPDDYQGNPRLTDNNGENYAYLNFFGDDGMVWDSITFEGLGYSGFESDNWAVRELPWGNLPGETSPHPGIAMLSIDGQNVNILSTPEPSTPLLSLLACFALISRRRRA